MLDMKEGYRSSSGYHFFKNNKLSQVGKAYHWQLYWPLLYIKDVLYTFLWCLKLKKRIYVYFAAGNLNPLVGIILREIGIVKKVIYQSIDYYPTRFENKFFNWFYYQLDKFCVRFSDETWNLNSAMVDARERKMKMNRRIYNKQYTVPGVVWFYKTRRLPFANINTKKIVYRGSLIEFMGVDLVIRAMPYILKKIPQAKLEIIGGGKEKNNFKYLAHNLGISKNVIFHKWKTKGWIKDRKKLEKVLSDGALGVATFNTDILDEKVRNSDPGKIKDYMLFGMPIITTNAISYSEEIIKNKCGFVVNYNVKELASAVINLLKSKSLLRQYRQNAIKFIEKFDCKYIYKHNIERVLKN